MYLYCIFKRRHICYSSLSIFTKLLNSNVRVKYKYYNAFQQIYKKYNRQRLLFIIYKSRSSRFIGKTDCLIYIKINLYIWSWFWNRQVINDYFIPFVHNMYLLVLCLLEDHEEGREELFFGNMSDTKMLETLHFQKSLEYLYYFFPSNHNNARVRVY